MGTILVTGGAGYIGSHIVRRLLRDGRNVLVLDDLSEGHRAAATNARLVEGDFGDPGLLDRLLPAEEVRFVIHMAACSLVGESITDPAKYYRNNVAKGVTLLEAAVRHGLRGIVFSSTAAVYGEPVEIPISEAHPQVPVNPYGETKAAFERALHWFRRAHGIRFAALRYFNAAGAHPDGTIGEDHEPETHLIPNLLRAIAAGGPPVPLFGDDYPTSDGTCVRDYIHVVDLAEAHVLALEALESGAVDGEALNLGNGAGFSVRQVVEAVERVTGETPPTRRAPRRPGDPATLVASSRKARERLNWRPALSALDEIVGTAWDWHRSHPNGFGERSGRI